jgi:hypothetical protein
MLPPLIWLLSVPIIALLAFFWFRSMDSAGGRVLVVLGALAALLYVTYRVSKEYPSATPRNRLVTPKA